MTSDDLRDEFMRLLTEDSETKDARRRDFNQAIFMPDLSGTPDYATRGVFSSGKAIWTETTLDMVLDKYDKAVKNLRVKQAKAGIALNREVRR